MEMAYITTVMRSNKNVEFQLRLTVEGDVGAILIDGEEVCSFDWDENMRKLFNKAVQQNMRAE